MNNRDNDGYILITILLLMLVLTVVGLSAIGTSTVENALSGNTRLKVRALAISESGVDIAQPLVLHAMRKNDLDGFTDIINDSLVMEEGYEDPDEVEASADLQFTVDSDSVSVDIDKKMILKPTSGTNLEFASGYEGIGHGGGGGSSALAYFKINSRGKGLARSEADVGTMLRYVP